MAALSGLLLLLGATCLWTGDDGAWSLVGMLVAVTPMVIFLGASLTPNGPEIAGGLALVSAAIGLSRARGRPAPARIWLTLGVAGVIVGLARALSPTWVVAAAALASRSPAGLP